MSRRRTFLRKFVRALYTLLLAGSSVVAGSCAGETNGGGTDSNTHWLRSCTSDGDCGSLSCVCGACTRSCTDATLCSGLPGARCTRSAACAGVEQSTCEAACDDDSDCSRLGAELRCSAGVCRESRGADAGAGSGGSGGENSSSAGAENSTGGGSGASATSTAGGGSDSGRGGSASALGGAVGGLSGVSCGTPMQVRNDGSACSSAPRYYWAAGWCMPFRCESCVGADCDALYVSASECDTVYTACYEDLGLRRECAVDSDCGMALRGCCGSCGVNDESALLGIRADSVDSYVREVCGDVLCPECVTTAHPDVYAACDSGLCVVKRR